MSGFGLASSLSSPGVSAWFSMAACHSGAKAGVRAGKEERGS